MSQENHNETSPLLSQPPETRIEIEREKTHFESRTEDEPTPSTLGTQPSVAEAKPKKAPPKEFHIPKFLDREIIVENHHYIDHKTALEAMRKNFQNEHARWKSQTRVFKVANLVVTLLVILVQLSEVIVFQIPTVPTNTKQALATILPAITGAVLGIQLKLGWPEKGQKCKKAAKLYNILGQHVNYRIELAEADGITDDTVKLINTALLATNENVPAFLTLY
ncbi:uncharacterized protein LOC143447504 [Clavelina lepadiformis]|uniref:uncharacterized protein LOC143447504 n=1 Tax=Clavelina lepadiformis TaxID=159417 RepID=UPI004041D760